MKKRIKIVFPLIWIISLVNLVSAYSWGRGYGSSPLDFLENEWIQFSLIFVLFFAIVFFAVSKTFKENKGAAAVVAIVVAAFISIAVAQNGWLYSYAGEGIGSWALVFAVILAIGFIIKLMLDVFGRFGGIAAVIFFWIGMQFVDIYEFYSLEVIGTALVGISEYIIFSAGRGKAIIGLVATVVIIGLIWKFGKKKRSALEQLARS